MLIIVQVLKPVWGPLHRAITGLCYVVLFTESIMQVQVCDWCSRCEKNYLFKCKMRAGDAVVIFTPAYGQERRLQLCDAQTYLRDSTISIYLCTNFPFHDKDLGLNLGLCGAVLETYYYPLWKKYTAINLMQVYVCNSSQKDIICNPLFWMSANFQLQPLSWTGTSRKIANIIYLRMEVTFYK